MFQYNDQCKYILLFACSCNLLEVKDFFLLIIFFYPKNNYIYKTILNAVSRL